MDRPTILHLAFILLLATGCNGPTGTGSDQDFSLLYEDDIDRIDFDSATLTRKYMNSLRTINIDIEQNIRRKILAFILDNNVLNIDPSKLTGYCTTHTMPESSFSLEIAIGEKQPRRFSWTSNNCGDEVDVLYQLSDLIKEHTVDRISAEKLPPTDVTSE